MSAYAQFGYSYPTASQILASPPLNATATSPSGGALSPGALSSASTTTTSGAPAHGATSVGGASTPVGSATGPRCCENGRPMMTDPVTGHIICSCQYDQARLALAYPRLGPGGPSYSTYPTAAPATAEQAAYPSMAMDSAPFYAPLGNPGMGMTADMQAAWGPASLQSPATNYYYDSALAAYGYGAGYDLAARRKNATRESTATLKAWLNEHKKNPYPTKGEKIMLAIITKMTLTQVSTWFANARRRLKKENKMTWEPKNKTDDDDDAVLSDSEDNKEKDEAGDGRGAERSGDEARRGIEDAEPMRHVKAEHVQHDKDLDDEDELELEDDPRQSELPYHHALHHHHHTGGYGSDEHLKEDGVKPDCCVGGVPIPATKPKIWSLADTAACKTPPPSSHPHHQQYHLHQQQIQQQQQQQQHYVQQQQQHHTASQPHHHSQQPWLGSGSTTSGLSSFALPSSTAMSPSSAATAPYSGASARYGGYLSSSSGGQLHYNPNPSSGSASSASSSAAAGFPEVGTDTPPQTPPNMKVSTPNGVIQGPPTGYCPGGNNNNNSNGPVNNNHYNHNSGYLSSGSASSASSFGSRLPNSPHKDFSPVSQNSILHQHQTTGSSTAFKPFYKGSPTMNSGFVSPV